jgi:DNA (cytosine-5)-methyltransferase 1
MELITHGSLFSGIGGFDLAAQWAGYKNIFQVEIDEFCQKVLHKNFPNVDKYGDIKEFNAKIYNGRVDIISGGFPCQPFSFAGKKKGKQDDRYLWHEMLRVITEVKPKWVIAENVYGLVTMQNGMVLEQVLVDLESEGYEVQPYVIPACSKNAPHRRDRIWIVANAKSHRDRCQQDSERLSWNERDSTGWERMGDKLDYSSKTVAETSWERNWLDVASELCRTDDGVSNRVDRNKALGNAIVPHVAFEIFNVIKQIIHYQAENINSNKKFKEQLTIS